MSISSQIRALNQRVKVLERLAINRTPKYPPDDSVIALHIMERRHIERAVLQFGNREDAAKALEISERTLYRKLLSYRSSQLAPDNVSAHKGGD